MLDYDQYSESFQLKLDGGKDRLPSRMGTLCSIIQLFVTMAYAYLKMGVLINKRDVDILSAIAEDDIGVDFIFEAK